MISLTNGRMGTGNILSFEFDTMSLKKFARDKTILPSEHNLNAEELGVLKCFVLSLAERKRERGEFPNTISIVFGHLHLWSQFPNPNINTGTTDTRTGAHFNETCSSLLWVYNLGLVGSRRVANSIRSDARSILWVSVVDSL